MLNNTIYVKSTKFTRQYFSPSLNLGLVNHIELRFYSRYYQIVLSFMISSQSVSAPVDQLYQGQEAESNAQSQEATNLNEYVYTKIK